MPQTNSQHASLPPHQWREHVLERNGKFVGARIAAAHVAQSIDRLQQFLIEPVDAEWLRAQEDELWTNFRRRRGRSPGSSVTVVAEAKTERDILESHFDELNCLGGTLVDGVDAFPLALGNTVEADMFLLMRDVHGSYRLLLVEVKETHEHAWYAAIENVLQMKLMQANTDAQTIFHRRNPQLHLPSSIPLVGLVLEPATYYEGRKQKFAVEPAYALITALGIDIRLAIWNEASRSISDLPGAAEPR